MRLKFDEQLTQLNNLLIEMGGMVEKAISSATKALIEQDVKLAKSIIGSDDDIDLKEQEIEDLCLKIILQQQPVAKDLRLVSSVLKMVTDIERIGDHATDISEITVFLAETEHPDNFEHIPKMAEATIKMVGKSIEAFVKKDLDLAKEVIDYDDVVDDLFDVVKNEIIQMIKKDEIGADQAIDFIMIAKYFERIGDHATNIAEWVVFSLTGKGKHEGHRGK